jgi:UDP:flavonoid glycosyltransferase YjiC (YdhE family)
MKIVLNAQGSQGDVRPVLALGLALRKSGHEILFCAPVNFGPLASQYGFNFQAVGGDFKEFMDQNKELAGHPVKLIKAFAKGLQDQLSAQIQSLIEAVKGADLLVGAGIDFVGKSVAEYTKIPYRYICYVPLAFKSRNHPPNTIPYRKLPGWMNLFFGWINEVVWQNIMGLKAANDINRRRLDLGEVKHIMDYMMEKTIISASSVLAPMPSDIRVDYIQTGYWYLDDETPLDDELNRFIEAGPPPVYFGFGSMEDPDPDGTAKILQELKCSGRVRLIVSKGWAKLGIGDQSQNIFLIDYAPHAKLFPKMAAVIHHGGAGTTHMAARAGVPQIIVPHILDQYYWGERVFALKLGPKPIPRRRLSSLKLLAAIDEAINNPVLKKNVAEMGRTLQQEDGLQEALNYFNSIIA